ncbi:Eukaryotic translation initiation factor 2C [Gryganskiella cystojenkinii]|nr:Eukaryotic translation initiation factor 2C [Gryganskiella cystojenkinii]
MSGGGAAGASSSMTSSSSSQAPAIVSGVSSTGLQLTEFVGRPGLGTQGRKVRIRANFFEISLLPNINVHHYDVTITPDVPPLVNRRVFEHFLLLHRTSDLAGALPVFDGRKNIFSPKEFKFDGKTFDIILPEDEPPKGVTPRSPPRSFKVKVKKAADINLEELHQFLDRKIALTNNCRSAIMALDVLIRHKPAMLYSSVGRSFFTPEGAQPLYGGVEVWNGFYQSARPALGKMLINLDVAATAYYQSGSLIELAVKILDFRSVDDFRRKFDDRSRRKLEKTLRGLLVKVTHRAEVKRKFKISKLTPTPASSTKFMRGEVKTDVATYFQETYNRSLMYPFMPCIVTGRDVFLPMEICYVIEGQRHLKKLDERQTADMIKFTCQPPSARANKIKDGLQILSYKDNEFIKGFGLKISNDMKELQARVLPPPVISYHPTSLNANFTPRDGSWNLRDRKVANGAILGSWGVLVFGTERDVPQSVVQGFIRELVVTCIDTGMNIPNKEPPIVYGSVHGNIEELLKKTWLAAGNQVKSQPQLLVCVLPNTGVSLYANIKRVTDTIIGISSQCIQQSHIYRPKKQYCANVCLKINVKLGGMNSFLSPQQTPFLTLKPTILFGADVSHPPPGDTTRPSIASLVGSMDAKAAKYSAVIRVQDARTETIADLGGMVTELLKTFYQTCGQKPARILFYRDGVSEGQFAAILASEVASVRDLQSHAGLQGTSRPTHYHVLCDDNRFTADQLQEFTYKLCHLYARCTRTVSMVPPAYYAHLVAARARFHARDWSDHESYETASVGSNTDETNSGYNAVKPELAKVMYFM